MSAISADKQQEIKRKIRNRRYIGGVSLSMTLFTGLVNYSGMAIFFATLALMAFIGITGDQIISRISGKRD